METQISVNFALRKTRMFVVNRKINEKEKKEKKENFFYHIFKKNLNNTFPFVLKKETERTDKRIVFIRNIKCILIIL